MHDGLCRSWLGSLAGRLSTVEQPISLAEADLAFLNSLFEQYVDAGLALVRSKCHEVIKTVDINLVTSLTYLLQASLCLSTCLLDLFATGLCLLGSEHSSRAALSVSSGARTDTTSKFPSSCCRQADSPCMSIPF